jgi:hypothetical protein
LCLGQIYILTLEASAAKTAALLNGGHLDGSQLEIQTSASHAEDAAKDHATTDGEIEQEHKPRSAVAAELLASGYVLSDAGLQKAIELDGRLGISERFLNFFRPLRRTTVAKGQEIDQNHGISAKAASAASTVDGKLHATERAQQAWSVRIVVSHKRKA